MIFNDRVWNHHDWGRVWEKPTTLPLVEVVVVVGAPVGLGILPVEVVVEDQVEERQPIRLHQIRCTAKIVATCLPKRVRRSILAYQPFVSVSRRSPPRLVATGALSWTFRYRVKARITPFLWRYNIGMESNLPWQMIGLWNIEQAARPVRRDYLASRSSKSTLSELEREFLWWTQSCITNFSTTSGHYLAIIEM